MADHLAGGVDPELLTDMSHTSAAALLDRVHHTEDPEVVRRVLTIVENEGVDVIAELWSHCDPDSLPGMLWRLYMLRTWMRKHDTAVARLWRVGEPSIGSASAVAGVDAAPTEDDIARTADSILAGAFTGDFAVALERAAAFVTVVALGLRTEAAAIVSRADQASDTAEEQRRRSRGATMLHTAANLAVTAKAFRHGATLWRRGKLE